MIKNRVSGTLILFELMEEYWFYSQQGKEHVI